MDVVEHFQHQQKTNETEQHRHWQTAEIFGTENKQCLSHMHAKTDVCRANWMLKCIKSCGHWTKMQQNSHTRKKYLRSQHAFIEGLSWTEADSGTKKCLCSVFFLLLLHFHTCTFAFCQELVSVATFICCRCFNWTGAIAQAFASHIMLTLKLP